MFLRSQTVRSMLLDCQTLTQTLATMDYGCKNSFWFSLISQDQIPNILYRRRYRLNNKYEKVSIKSWISRLLAIISNSILVKTVKIHVKGAFFDCNFKSWQDMFDLSPPGMPKDLGPLIGALDQGTSCTRFLVFVASSGELVRNLNRTNNTYYYG